MLTMIEKIFSIQLISQITFDGIIVSVNWRFRKPRGFHRQHLKVIIFREKVS